MDNDSFRTYTVTFEVAVKIDDPRTADEIARLVTDALDAIPDVPYLDYTDFSFEES